MSENHNTDEPLETEDNTASINRRRFVKTVGAASSAVGIGALGAGSASASSSREDGALSAEEAAQRKDELVEALEAYNTPQDAENAIQSHGTQLVDELSQRKIISSTSVSDLDTNEFTSEEAYISNQEGMGITSFFLGKNPTAHIFVSKQTPDHHITMVVEPQIERSFAIVKDSPESQENVDIIDTSNNADFSASSDNNLVTNANYRGRYCIDRLNDNPSNCQFNGCAGYDYFCRAGGGCYLGAFGSCCDFSFNDFGNCYSRVLCRFC